MPRFKFFLSIRCANVVIILAPVAPRGCPRPSPEPYIFVLSTEELLKREDIFGVDLYKVGLATKVLDIYNEMQGVGAVRKTLNKYVDK